MTDKHLLSQQAILAANIAHIRDSIVEAAARSGRSATEITLVAVSKTQPLELIKQAYTLGVTTFGENRVQEALAKIDEFHPTGIHWHMIGHVQRNKAAKVVGAFDCIHSVDSLALAQLLDRHAAHVQRRQAVLLQVNISGEESKEGMTAEEALGTAGQIAALPNLEVQGLMTVAPLVADPAQTRPVFRALRLLRDRLRHEVTACSWQHLSMGMTDDYQVAIEEGATIVRVGRAIFGERVYKGDT